MKTGTDLINEAKGRIREVSPTEALQEQDTAVFIDCREPNEFNLGRVMGALFIPRGILETNVEAAIPRDRKVVVYCASGNRSALATETLLQLGYTDVVSLAGGFRGWAEAGGDIDD